MTIWRIFRHRLDENSFGMWAIARGYLCVAHAHTFEEIHQMWIDGSKEGPDVVTNYCHVADP